MHGLEFTSPASQQFAKPLKKQPTLLFKGRYGSFQLFQAIQAQTFVIKLADILNRFKRQTNVRAITAMNAISLANELPLTTGAMFRFMFTVEIFSEQGALQ